MSTLLNKDALLEKQFTKFEDVPMPEFGEEASLRIAVMSGASRDAYEEEVSKQRDDNDDKLSLVGMRARLIVLSAINELGDRIFADEDLDKVNALPSDVIDRLFDVAGELNGLKAQAAEDAAKNSESAPS